MEPAKRRLRKHKRVVKKAGNKALRQRLARDLRDRPEDAHSSETEYGRDSSTGFNGLDEDRTRRRPEVA